MKLNRRAFLKGVSALLAAPVVGRLRGLVPKAAASAAETPTCYLKGTVLQRTWPGHVGGYIRFWDRPLSDAEIATIRRSPNLFVGPGGDDSASGLTYADRWRSLQKAVDQARRGDRIIVTSSVLYECVTLGQPKETDGDRETSGV